MIDAVKASVSFSNSAITRKVAPYVGVTYLGKFGGTADFARAAGHATDEVRFTMGLRTWF